MLTLEQLNPLCALFQVSKAKDERGKPITKKPVPWGSAARALWEESPGVRWRNKEKLLPLSTAVGWLSSLQQPEEAPFFLTLAVVHTPGWGAVDFDPANDAQRALVRELASVYAKAGVAVDMTPSGGCHIFFEWDERTVRTNYSGYFETPTGILLVDVFVNTHLTAIYDLRVCEKPFLSSELTTQLLACVKKSEKNTSGGTSSTTVQRYDLQLDSSMRIPNGRRWLTMQRIAARLAGAPPEVTRRLILMINESFCDPPLEREQVLKIADWVATAPSLETLKTGISVAWWPGEKDEEAATCALARRLHLPLSVARNLVRVIKTVS